MRTHLQAALFCLLVGAVTAGEPELNYEAAALTLGVWRLSVEPPEDDGPDTDDRQCNIEFLASAPSGRFDMKPDAACAVFPGVARAVGWTAHDSGATAFDQNGREVANFVHRGPDWMLASMPGDPTRYTLGQAMPRGVRAMSADYYLFDGAEVPYAGCTVTLAPWHGPIAPGATRVAYGVTAGSDCPAGALGNALSWRPLPDPAGGWLVVILSPEQRELGRFAEREGWELGLFGTLLGRPFRLERKPP